MKIKELDSIKFFFVLGRPRSGTTLLNMLFNAHPNVVMSMETKLITNIYFKYKNVNVWDENKIISLFNYIFTLERIKYLELNTTKLKKEMLSLGDNANLSRLIKTIYLNFISFYPKDKIIWIGDKTPQYSMRKHYFKIFKELFPDLKVVHLVRDYMDHYLSVNKVDFKFKQRSIVAYRWLYSYKIITEEFANNDNKYFFLRHEDLVSEPEKYLKDICIFLDIEYKKDMLDFYKIKDMVIDNISTEIFKKFHSKLLQPITNKYIYGWEKQENKEFVKIMDSIVGDEAEKAGYKREYFAKPNSFLIWYLKSITNIIEFLLKINDSFPHKIKNSLNKPIIILSYLLIKPLRV